MSLGLGRTKFTSLTFLLMTKANNVRGLSIDEIQNETLLSGEILDINNKPISLSKSTIYRYLRKPGFGISALLDDNGKLTYYYTTERAAGLLSIAGIVPAPKFANPQIERLAHTNTKPVGNAMNTARLPIVEKTSNRIQKNFVTLEKLIDIAKGNNPSTLSDIYEYVHDIKHMARAVSAIESTLKHLTALNNASDLIALNEDAPEYIETMYSARAMAFQLFLSLDRILTDQKLD